MLKRYSAANSPVESGVDAPAKKGLAVILIHGWGLNSLLWQKVLPQLTQHRDVYTYDIYGYGDTALKETELVLPENYFVIGFSLGGVVASTPDLSPFNKMKGLVTVSTNAKFLASDDWICAMDVEDFESFSNQMTDDVQGASDRVLRRFTALQCKGSQTMRDELSYLRVQQASANKTAVKILQDGLQCLASSDLRNTWKSFPVPSLHQFGAADSLVPVAAAKHVAGTLGRAVQVFEKSAHQPFLAESDSWVASINRFASEQLAEGQYV